MNNSSAVVVFSGGQDSTTCLLQALQHYDNVKAITFVYGQRHIVGNEISKKICSDFGIDQKIVDVSLMNELTTSALLNNEEPISRQKNSSFPNTFVPGRNLIFISLATIYAYSLKYGHVITGVCQTDFSGYPDCRDEFVKSLNKSLNLALDNHIQIETPLMWKDKAETWAIADKLGYLKYIKENTLSCYEGVLGDGCGTCPACILRQAGLTKYLNERKN